jgi:hypothetical protein
MLSFFDTHGDLACTERRDAASLSRKEAAIRPTSVSGVRKVESALSVWVMGAPSSHSGAGACPYRPARPRPRRVGSLFAAGAGCNSCWYIRRTLTRWRRPNKRSSGETSVMLSLGEKTSIACAKQNAAARNVQQSPSCCQCRRGSGAGGNFRLCRGGWRESGLLGRRRGRLGDAELADGHGGQRPLSRRRGTGSLGGGRPSASHAESEPRTRPT